MRVPEAMPAYDRQVQFSTRWLQDAAENVLRIEWSAVATGKD